MKILISLMLIVISFSSEAFVNSNECPNNFVITYYNISRGPLSRSIQGNSEVRLGWESIREAQKFELDFKLVTKTSTAYCEYANGKNTATLQNKNGFDELVIPYSNNLYFRTKVLAFSDDYIELAVDEDSKKILFPVIEINSNGDSKVVDEIAIGEADGVRAEVLE